MISAEFDSLKPVQMFKSLSLSLNQWINVNDRWIKVEDLIQSLYLKVESLGSECI